MGLYRTYLPYQPHKEGDLPFKLINGCKPTENDPVGHMQLLGSPDAFTASAYRELVANTSPLGRSLLEQVGALGCKFLIETVRQPCWPDNPEAPNAGLNFSPASTWILHADVVCVR